MTLEGRCEAFRERLRSGRPLLLDAALGTELERRGVTAEPPLWSAAALLSAPAAVRAIHAENGAAGAEILTADTFRTHRRSLEPAGLGDRSAALTAVAVELTRQAAAETGRPVFVAGSLAPLEDCFRPDLVPDDAALSDEHRLHAGEVARAGADVLIIETQNSVREMAAAARAAKRTGLPVVVSMVTDGAGRLLSGEPIEEAVRELAPIGPDALAINCVPARRLGRDLRVLAAAAPGVLLGAWGNLGAPLAGGGWSDPVPPDEYARLALDWVAAGARIVGGCCHTTALHTAATRRALDAPLPPRGQSRASGGLSGA